MRTFQGPSLIRVARALRLRARGHHFRAEQACVRAHALCEQAWARKELARMDLIDWLETRRTMRCARVLRAGQGPAPDL